MDKLQTFAAANGWTVDNYDATNDKLSMHIGSLYTHFHWDNTTFIGMFQSLGFTAAGTNVDSHPDDSGNIAEPTGTITGGHKVRVDNGPYTAYHFFENGGGTENHIHVVLEYDADFFVHFSIGEIVKFNDFTGGEYCVGFDYTTSFLQSTNRQDKFGLWDARCTTSSLMGYLHVEGLTNQSGSGKWGTFGSAVTARGNDSAAVVREKIVGGVRGGPFSVPAYYEISGAQAFIPLNPIGVWHVDTSTTPDHWYYLGYVPNARICNITNLVPGVEFTFGGDTWIAFPYVNKKIPWTNDAATVQSGSYGIAYKKIT